MMRSVTVQLVFLLIACQVSAQETIVWGSEVVDVSSEYSPLEYSAIQALHKPNVLPSGGDNPNAWRPKSDNKEEFIMVSFDKPIKAKQVAIAESENPGAITRVYAYDQAYNEYTLFELTPRQIPIDSRLLNLFFEDTPYEIYAIKIFIDGEVVPGYNAIDAIGISNSNIPINVLINLAPGLEQNAQADRLGASVNSQYIEHSPIISPDGKHLYFSRRYHPDNVGGVDDVEDIWVSDLDPETGEWLPAKNLGPPLNTEGPNFISSITIVDGEEVVILGNRYGKKGTMYSGVSVSQRKGDNFEKPQSIEVENEYNYSPKVDYFLAPNGEAMVISAERDDSYGGRDLYVSFKNGNAWSEPMNLGNDVNTAGEDYSPFLGQDNKTLYYSTNGISGFGKADIFVAIRLDNTWEKWSIPENLGASLNSKNDDQYFSIPSSGKHIYFSRGNVDEDTDIFRFNADELVMDEDNKLLASMGHLIPEEEVLPELPVPLFVIAGTVLDYLDNSPIPTARVAISRLPDGVQIGETNADASGNFSITVRPDAWFALTGMHDGYLDQSINIDLNKVQKVDSLHRNITLMPFRTGVAIAINNIFFETNKAVLKTSSYSELNRILEFLNGMKIKRMKVTGHTDDVGDDNYNLNLSRQRAQAVYEFFVANGVSPERLEYEGFGETMPKVPNNSSENRTINRRVEFTILE